MWDFLLWLKRVVILLALAWAGVHVAPPERPVAPDRAEPEASRPSACLKAQHLAVATEVAPLG